MPLPDQLQINAWAGEPCQSATDPRTTARWAGGRPVLVPKPLLPQPPADPWDWRHPDVGWGLVMADCDGYDDAQKALAEDAPEPIRRLVEARGNPAPVFRYHSEAPLWQLTRYYVDRPSVAFSVIAARHGTAPDCLPRFLLMYGPPTSLPWTLQYRLQAIAFVGRLDLDGDELDRYVTALIEDWPASQARPDQAVIWAVDHSPNDITHLMRTSIADKLAARIDADLDLNLTFHGRLGAGATGGNLLDSLRDRRPSLIVTTSHGQTPAPGPSAAAKLGLPMDENHASLDLDQLTADSLTDGAIWYAHACCSAGSASASGYDGVVPAGSRVDRVLKGVAAIGDLVAPLPRALLGAQRPCRAFIGHVEPTFDWTLRQRETGQLLTESLVTALYANLYRFHPISYALDEVHQHGPQLELLHRQAVDALDDGDDRVAEMLAYRLTAQDRESLVILGDPTVALPPLAGG